MTLDERLTKVVPHDRQFRFQELEFYAFVHFTVNTFTDREWGDGMESPSIFDPEKLDAEQWVRAVKSAGMRGLHSVTIPTSVTTIGEYAFYGCWSLHSVTIPTSVTTIGEYAFSGCSSLHSVAILSSVMTIGNWAFLCNWLQSVTIPESLVVDEGKVFPYDCKVIRRK